MRGLRNRLVAGAGVLLTIGALLLTATSAATAKTATPGAPGLGDTLFPNLGNGGYDATRYSLKLRYPTSAPAQQVQGRMRMDAVATQDLSAFNLDFGGDTVAAVLVNGRSATIDWQKNAEELTITPTRPIRDGRRFTVVVEFTSHPSAPAPDNPYPVGWVATPHGSFTSFQPNLAHQTIPVNDHPADKATWRFELDVPQGVTALANGASVGKRNTGDRTVWTYEECNPLAAELIQLAVGTDLTIVRRATTSGVTYRDVIAQGPKDLLEPAFAQGPAQLTWAINKAGRFPSPVYGNLGIDLRFGYALETQGIALYSEGLFNPDFIPGRTGQEWFYSSIMIHEIAHEYYGNSVSPATWSDLWLNEGWATFFMKTWEQEQGTIDEWGNPSIEDYMKEVYTQGDIWRSQFGPVARPLSAEVLFGPNAYDGGALVLYALQQEVGTKTFNAILTGWPKKFRDTSQGTDDFIAFASRVAGRDLTDFLTQWLYDEKTPPMPGHPDWTVDPVTAAATAKTMAQTAEHAWHHPHRAAR